MASSTMAFIISTPVGRRGANLSETVACKRRGTGTVQTSRNCGVAGERTRCTPIARAVEFDQNSVIAVLTAAAGLIGGISLVAWTESQGERTAQRGNKQPCVECGGTTTTTCTVCEGTTKNPLDNSKPCSYCDGSGSIKCFNCSGTGIQPRFLDRYGLCLALFQVSFDPRFLDANTFWPHYSASNLYYVKSGYPQKILWTRINSR